MAYNALKSVDLTNFMNILMCFLVSCSNRGGQVSPVRNMAFCRILSSCVQFKIVWLILCSSFSPQGYIELEIILILWWYDLVKPWPITIAVNSAEIGIVVFILSFMYGKNNVCVCVCVCVCWALAVATRKRKVALDERNGGSHWRMSVCCLGGRALSRQTLMGIV